MMRADPAQFEAGAMGREDSSFDLASLAEAPRGARLLGLDLGTRTIGLAISDVERLIATPLDTVRRTKVTADGGRLKAVADRCDVAGLVIGLPLNMDGSEGPRAQSTRAFARRI